MAEGPTIQRASERALRSGTNLLRVLELVKRLRAELELPIVLMGYANVFFARGEQGFAEGAADAGVDGVIIVDLPPEEGQGMREALTRRGIDPILLAAPTTTPARLELLARTTRGFLYFVSLTGVTGARPQVAADIEAQVRAARACGIPVCVGFGVSTAAHAESVGRYADGVVVGSALIDQIENVSDLSLACERATAFVASLKKPLRQPAA
jgi:tryptophan synthase alpha chain